MTSKDQISHEPACDSTDPRTSRCVHGEILIHPLSLLCLGLWALNDHYGKGAWPGWLSGKLSDVVSLIGFPLLVGAFFELVIGLFGAKISRARAVGVIACRWGAVSAAIVMIGINLWPSWADAYEVGLGAAQWTMSSAWRWLTDLPILPRHRVSLTMDPTDLITTPAALVGPWLYQRVVYAHKSRAHRLVDSA